MLECFFWAKKMNSNILVRQYIQQTLKDFPWSYHEQETTLLALIDGILSNRYTSWNGIVRWSFDDITVKKFWYLAHNSYDYLEGCFKKINSEFNNIDKRSTFYVSIDDTGEQRYGSKVFAASSFKNHTNNGYTYGNTIVDCYVHSNTYLETSYLPYISKKYIESQNDESIEFQTKIQLALHQIQLKLNSLINHNVSSTKIWLTMDSWYISDILIRSAKEWGINYLVGVKKNAVCVQFGKTFNLENLMDNERDWKKIKNQETGTVAYYKTRTLNFQNYGRCKLFAIKRGQDKRIHYYITNQLKMTIQTFANHWKHHWQIERFHFYIKEFFGFEECYSGSEMVNRFQWLLSHVLYKLFWSFQKQLQRKGLYFTLERLWEYYCLDYDIERSYKLAYSPKNQNLLKQKLEVV